MTHALLQLTCLLCNLVTLIGVGIIIPAATVCEWCEDLIERSKDEQEPPRRWIA